MNISYKLATTHDFEYLKQNDHHIEKKMLHQKITHNEILIAKEDNMTIGFLRFHFFWDAIPFLSMLILEKEYRGKGIGKEFVHFWETEMKKMGYDCCMTSTLSNEDGQHFYRKLGYKDVGCLLLEEEGLEIFFLKKI